MGGPSPGRRRRALRSVRPVPISPAPLIEKIQSHQADRHAKDLVHGDRLMVQQRAHRQQGYGQKGALDRGDRADRPSHLIGIDKAHLQAHHGHAQQHRRGIHLPVLLQQAPASIRQEKQRRGTGRPHQIRHCHGRHGVHLLGNRFGADLINDIGKDHQCDGPDIGHKILLQKNTVRPVSLTVGRCSPMNLGYYEFRPLSTGSAPRDRESFTKN